MSKLLATTILFIAVALGHAQVNRTGRIFGGHNTTIEKIPWQVGVFLMHNSTWIYYCSGSIISSEWIVSAGHCFAVASYDRLIHAGSADVYSGGSNHTVILQTVHPNRVRVGNISMNDIAVVKVGESFIFDKTRQPVPLYTTNDKLPVGSFGTVSGWGLTDDGEYPTILKSVKIPIMSMSECRQFIGSLYDNYAGFFCAGHPEGGKNTCSADSGGPFTVNGSLVGIVSVGPKKCTQGNSASIYINVAYFHEWIMLESGDRIVRA